MKKLIAGASSFVLIIATPVAFPTVGHARGVSDHVDTCKVYVDLDLYSRVGECVRENEVSPVRLCQFLADEGLYPYEFDDKTVENRGECVRWFRQHR